MRSRLWYVLALQPELGEALMVRQQGAAQKLSCCCCCYSRAAVAAAAAAYTMAWLQLLCFFGACHTACCLLLLNPSLPPRLRYMPCTQAAQRGCTGGSEPLRHLPHMSPAAATAPDCTPPEADAGVTVLQQASPVGVTVLQQASPVACSASTAMACGSGTASTGGVDSTALGIVANADGNGCSASSTAAAADPDEHLMAAAAAGVVVDVAAAAADDDGNGVPLAPNPWPLLPPGEGGSGNDDGGTAAAAAAAAAMHDECTTLQQQHEPPKQREQQQQQKEQEQEQQQQEQVQQGQHVLLMAAPAALPAAAVAAPATAPAADGDGGWELVEDDGPAAVAANASCAAGDAEAPDILRSLISRLEPIGTEDDVGGGRGSGSGSGGVESVRAAQAALYSAMLDVPWLPGTGIPPEYDTSGEYAALLLQQGMFLPPYPTPHSECCGCACHVQALFLACCSRLCCLNACMPGCTELVL